MPPVESEYLSIRGRLDRAGDFTPGRCGSTWHVRTWPEPRRDDRRDVVIETLDENGAVIRAEVPAVTSDRVCAPGDPSWRVRGYLRLDDHAAEVRLRLGDRVVWTSAVPQPPRVEVVLVSPPVRGSREPDQDRRGGRGARPYPGGEPAVIELVLSPPADRALAHVLVVHRWGERGFQSVHLGPARRRLSIDPDRLPGGDACELLVVYSNGLRSAIARTERFGLEPIGPVISIAQPSPSAVVTAGVPVFLEGTIADPEHPAVPLRNSAAIWIVDGEVRGQGPITSIDSLDEGDHVVELAYRAEEAPLDQLPRASVHIRARAARMRLAGDWPDFDPYERF